MYLVRSLSCCCGKPCFFSAPFIRYFISGTIISYEIRWCLRWTKFKNSLYTFFLLIVHECLRLNVFLCLFVCVVQRGLSMLHTRTPVRSFVRSICFSVWIIYTRYGTWWEWHLCGIFARCAIYSILSRTCTHSCSHSSLNFSRIALSPSPLHTLPLPAYWNRQTLFMHSPDMANGVWCMVMFFFHLSSVQWFGTMCVRMNVEFFLLGVQEHFIITCRKYLVWFVFQYILRYVSPKCENMFISIFCSPTAAIYSHFVGFSVIILLREIFRPNGENLKCAWLRASPCSDHPINFYIGRKREDTLLCGWVCVCVYV